MDWKDFFFAIFVEINDVEKLQGGRAFDLPFRIGSYSYPIHFANLEILV